MQDYPSQTREPGPDGHASRSEESSYFIYRIKFKGTQTNVRSPAGHKAPTASRVHGAKVQGRLRRGHGLLTLELLLRRAIVQQDNPSVKEGS